MQRELSRDQSGMILMQNLQKGIDSGDRHGWISEEETDRILPVDEEESDRKILDAAVAAHLTDPVTNSLDEVCELLDLREAN